MPSKLVREAEYQYECDRSWCHQPVVGRGYKIQPPVRYDYGMLYSRLAERRYCSLYCAMADRDLLFPITPPPEDKNGKR